MNDLFTPYKDFLVKPEYDYSTGRILIAEPEVKATNTGTILSVPLNYSGERKAGERVVWDNKWKGVLWGSCLLIPTDAVIAVFDEE